MSNWDAMTEAKKQQGNGIFLKLEENKVYEGVFRGEPVCFYKTKFGSQDRSESPTKTDSHPTFAFKINFVTVEDGAFVSKIIDGGARLRDAMLQAKDEYGLDCVFKIKKTGQKTNTQFAVLFKERLTPEVLDKVNAVPLRTLARSDAPMSSAGGGGTSAPF